MSTVARRAFVLVAAAGLFLAACSLDYDESQLASEISEDTPDTILFDVTNTIVRDGSPRFIVEADRAETFGQLDRQYLYEIRFRELNADGAVITDGVAAYAEYQTDTEDFELTGDLRFYSAAEEAWLSADYLYWDSDARLLTSEPEEPVIVERADGTTIRGRGFVAEMGRSIIRFEGGVSGTLVEDENPE
ncbi:MAG TPA: LPS export ABC transporter periplasmic protein LptC [Spirochaetia bacterium]|nr:LPS export ABC transporter periplasmic protein LptC [Spirochaetia bacterium]